MEMDRKRQAGVPFLSQGRALGLKALAMCEQLRDRSGKTREIWSQNVSVLLHNCLE